jgi:hypothetical protein
MESNAKFTLRQLKELCKSKKIFFKPNPLNTEDKIYLPPAPDIKNWKNENLVLELNKDKSINKEMGWDINDKTYYVIEGSSILFHSITKDNKDLDLEIDCKIIS